MALVRFILRRLTKWRTLLWVIIIGGLVGVSYYYGLSGIYGTPVGSYDQSRQDIQAAVTAYQDKHDGDLPVLNRTVTVNGSSQRLIDLCALKYRSEFLEQIPPGCAPDNCAAGGCTCTDGSYMWTVDEGGNVSSSCISLDCEAYQADGYQGVWP